MDKDILLQTDNYFEEFFTDRITNQDKEDIKQWLTIQLQQERQGWKNKLNMSLKEVERERKVALDNQGALHRVHDLLTQFVRTYGPILPSSPEVTETATIASEVELNTRKMFDLVNLFEEERAKCFDLLNLPDYQQMYLYEALKAHVGHLRARIKEIQSKALENERNLKEQLEYIMSNLEEEKKRNELENARFSRTIKVLREEIEKLKKMKEVVAEPKPATFNVRVQVDAWNLNISKEKEVQTEPLVVKCEKCTRKGTKPSAYHANLEVIEKEPEVVKLHKLDIGIESETENSNANESLYLSSVTEEDFRPIDDKLDDIMEPTPITKAPIKQKVRKISKLHKQSHNDSLRIQVVGHAERIEQEKFDLSPKITQKSGPFYRPHGAEVWVTSSQDISSARESVFQTGYLGGIKKDVLYPGRDRNIVAALNSSRKGFDISKSTSTSKCLRCHRTYKTRDNNALACRFHPKTKRKVEKYDNSGRLVKILYRWECCNKKAEAPGCCSGEHI